MKAFLTVVVAASSLIFGGPAFSADLAGAFC
jgi:hypothetical protein